MDLGQRLAGGREDAAEPRHLEDEVGEGVAGRGPGRPDLVSGHSDAPFLFD